MTEAERAMTPAERQARRHERNKDKTALACEALAFLLTLEEQDVYSMRHERRKVLRDLQLRGRLERFGY
jgi:hypothetical protein